MNEKYIVTGFTSEYWGRWGVSWLSSLEEHAAFDGKKVVVALDELPVADRLKKYNVDIVSASGGGDSRLRIFEALGRYASEKPGCYVYFDGDVYFQGNLGELFEIASAGMVMAGNANPGMLAGLSAHWQFFTSFCRAAIASGAGTSSEIIASFFKHLPHRISSVHDTWNWADLPRLSPLGEYWGHDGSAVHVVHPSKTKHLPEINPYLFENKFPNSYARWDSALNKKAPVLSKRLLLAV